MAVDTTKPLVLMGGAPSLERTMKETGYDPDGAVLAAGGIPEYIAAQLQPVQTRLSNLAYVLVSLSAFGWSGSAPYTQTVSVSGMTADWVPGIPTVMLGSSVDVSTLLSATEALGCIKMITSAAGTLTFIAPEDKPGISLKLRVPGQIEGINASVTVDRFYGIARYFNSTDPKWIRTGLAEGKNATASVGASAGHSDFDNIYPWSGIKRETFPTGDVMVKIPKFWFQRYREGNVEYINIAEKATAGFTLHPAFKHGGVEVDYIYVGAYKTSSNNKSVTGASPQVNQTRATMRSNAKNKGTGWSLIDISALSAIQMLMLVEFATNNVQSAIGRGYCDADGNSAAINTGSCNSVPNLTGRPAGTDGNVDVVWRGIEGLWGNVWEYVDGLNMNNGAYYVCNDISKYADDTATGYEQLSYTGATNWSYSYITEEGLDTGNNPHVIIPKAAGSGSESTYECDGCWSSTGWRVFLRGGRWTDSSICGLFSCNLVYNSSNSERYIGSRLLYIPS